jgi:hypothetical protein
MRASNASIAGGKEGLGAGAGGAAAEVADDALKGAWVVVADEGCSRFTEEDAMSSRREVAASSRLIRVVRLFILLAAMMGGQKMKCVSVLFAACTASGEQNYCTE